MASRAMRSSTTRSCPGMRRVSRQLRAFKFGTGVFEGLRGYWNEADQEMYLFRMAEHMQRLEFSQRFMRYEDGLLRRLCHREGDRAHSSERLQG